MSRPRRLVLVAGTGTEIGKTWMGAAVLGALRADGWRVAARKPAQSFDPGDDTAGVTDAQVLAAATGQDATTVCPPHRWYPAALAPPMAAAVLGRPPVLLAGLLAEVADATWSDGVDVGLVETAGGVRSPLAEDGDAVALAAALAPDRIVLVADAGLGTINAVHLSIDALATAAPRRDIVVALNRFDAGDDLHVRNHDWLTHRLGLACLTSVPALAVAIAPGAAPVPLPAS